MILSTDRQTDKVKPVYPPFNFIEAVGIINTLEVSAPHTHKWRWVPPQMGVSAPTL